MSHQQQADPHAQQQMHTYNPYGHYVPAPDPVDPDMMVVPDDMTTPDPVVPDEPVKPEGYYSIDMQFKPATIPYVPAKLHEPTFAICELDDLMGVRRGKIEFGQLPEHAM